MLKQFYFLSFFLLFIPNLVFGQGTCATAVNIAALPYQTPVLQQENLCGAGDDYDDAGVCGNRFMNGEDFVYRYTPAANTCITATASTNTANGIALFVTRGCPDNTASYCVRQATVPNPAGFGANEARVENVQLTGGVTYFFIVSAENTCFNFTFNLQQSNNCQPKPIGFDCESAEVINQLPFFDGDGNFNNCTDKPYRYLVEGNYCATPGYYLGQSHILKYQTGAVPEPVDITLVSRDVDGRISIHEGCPTLGNSHCVREIFVQRFTQIPVYHELKANTEYYFVISGFEECTPYDIRIEPPVNSHCTTALPVFPNAAGFYSQRIKTEDAGDSLKNDATCTDPITGNLIQPRNEYFFKYNSPGNECISAMATNFLWGNGFSKLALYKGCPNYSSPVELISACASQNNAAGFSYSITDPGTYFFVVSDAYVNQNFDEWFAFDFIFSNKANSNSLSQGQNCSNPERLTSSTNVLRSGINVNCGTNSVSSANACGNKFINGNEMVFTYTAPQDFCGLIMGTNVYGNGGIVLSDNCPQASNTKCLGATECLRQCDSISLPYRFEGGKTYFITVGAAAGGAFSMDLVIKKQFNSLDGCESCEVAAICEECENIGFEQGTFNGWTAYRGGYYVNTRDNLGWDTAHINALRTEHTLVSAGSYDMGIGGNALSTNSPFGGNYVARIGTYQLKGSVQLEYTLNVTAENQVVSYAYAPVLAGAHSAFEQAFFGARFFVIDENGERTEIDCAHFEARAGAFGQTGYDLSPDNARFFTPLYWRDWSVVTVPLQDYIGQQVRMEFYATECRTFLHVGMGYFDVKCQKELVANEDRGSSVICNNQPSEIAAPQGFSRYEWSDGETGRVRTVTQAGIYKVTLFTHTYGDQHPPCEYEMEIEVKSVQGPTANFTFDLGCSDAFVDFTNTSTGNADAGISHYEWNFDDGSGIYPDTNRRHAFPGPGTYNVQLIAFNTEGCSDTITKEVVIAEFPTIGDLDALDTIRVCASTDTNLFAKAYNGVGYEWFDPQGNSFSTNRLPNILNPQIPQSGKYTLIATRTNDPCITALDTTYLEVFPGPKYSWSEDVIICFNDPSVEMYVSGGGTKTWIPAAPLNSATGDTVLATLTENTVFTVQVDNAQCPDTTIQIATELINFEEALALPDDTTICEGEALTLSPLTGAPLDFLEWTLPNGEKRSTANLTFTSLSPQDAGKYVLKAFLGPNNFCLYGEAEFNLTVSTLADPGLNSSNLSGCEGDLLEFTVTESSLDYWWLNSSGDTLSTSNNLSVPAQDATFTLHYQNQEGCRGSRQLDAEFIEVIAPDLGNNRTACVGQSVTLAPFNVQEFDSDYSYLWNTGANSASITVTESGTYRLTVSKEGCEKSDEISVTFQDPGDFNMGNDTLLCSTDSLFLDYRGFGESITWNDGFTEFTRWIYPPSTTYSVSITSGSCVLGDEIAISFQDMVYPQLPADTVICANEQLELNGNPADASYRWYINGELFSEANSISLNEEGNYEVVLEAYNSVCSNQDSMEVVIFGEVGLALPDLSICEIDSAFVDASVPVTGASYVWQDGFSGAQRWVKDEGLYEVTITVSGCESEASFNLSHDPLPIIELGADRTICEDSVQVFAADVTSWEGYLWNTGETTTSITTSQSDWYWLETTQGACTYRDSVFLYHDTVPNFDLGGNQTICETDQITLDPGVSTNPQHSYSWNTGATTPTITVTQADTYTLTITNGLCRFSDSKTLDVQSLPGVDLGADRRLCVGDQIRIGFTAQNATYSWNTGATTDSITVGQTGTYALTLTQGFCTESDSIDIIFDALTAPDLGPDIVQCEIIDSVLDANTHADSYQWTFNGNVLAENGRRLQISQSGTYEVRAIMGTCEERDDIEVSIQQAPTLSMLTDSILCMGEFLTITPSTNALNPEYSWSTGESTESITVNSTDIYTLELTEGVCIVSAQTDVLVVPHPYIDLPEGSTICEDEVITIGEFFTDTIGLSPLEVEYEWNTGEDTARIRVNVAGQYIETVRIAHCFDTDYYNLDVVLKPVPQMSPDLFTCFNELQPISTGLPGLMTQWNLSPIRSHEITPQESGKYIATITDGPCVVKDSVEVTIYPIPESLDAELYICPNDSFELSFTQANEFLIYEGDTIQVLTMYPERSYPLEIVNTYGCRISQHVYAFLDKNCKVDLYIPNAFSPDNDGVNEVFRYVLSETAELISFEVYNRWGEKVFSTQQRDEFWDGTYLGKQVRQGVYSYQISYKDRYQIISRESGHVNVLR